MNVAPMNSYPPPSQAGQPPPQHQQHQHSLDSMAKAQMVNSNNGTGMGDHNVLSNEFSNLSLSGDKTNGTSVYHNYQPQMYQAGENIQPPPPNYQQQKVSQPPQPQQSFQHPPPPAGQSWPAQEGGGWNDSYGQASAAQPPPPSQQSVYNQAPYMNYNQTNGAYQQQQQPPQYGQYQQAPPPGAPQSYQAPPPPGPGASYQQAPPPGANQSYQQQGQARYGQPGAMSPAGGGYNQFGGGNAMAQQNKLDPDAMPSAVQVILEDKAKYESSNNVLFSTFIPATLPPLVTTIMENEEQVIQDGGTARPTFLRPTIYQVPVTEETLKTADIPLAMIVKPFDDQEVDGKIYVPVTNSEIVRCNRCKGYMNPYNRFIDGGRRFQCCMCHHVSEVPASYMNGLDHTGQRLDKYQKAELYLGSYEFRATEEYCRNNVMGCRRPHIIFAMELTETSKPILNHLAANLADIIRNLPKDSLNVNSLPPMVGFVTYNSKIQMYDVLQNGVAHVICDLSEPFAAFNTFLVDPLIHMDKIESFLQSLPLLYENEKLEMQTILGPVIEAALLTAQLDVNNWINQKPGKLVVDNNQNQVYETIPVGKCYIFHCTLPTYGNDQDVPGRIKQRWTTSIDEMLKLLGTDKEKTILSPESNKYYVELGQKCVSDFATGIELFLFPPANSPYLDVATLGEVSRLSGTGAVYRYFNDFSDCFLTDLKYSLYSSFAFDCVLKVRTSTGIRAHEYYGNFYSRSPSDIECAAINTSSNIIVDFKYDEKLPEDEHVVIQVAILYTSLSGERRVRLHNIALATCQQIGDVYRNACCDTVVNLIARNAVHHLRRGDKTIEQTKEAIIARVITILTSYRKHCAQPGTSLGQLILPEALKLLPVYVTGLLKCDAIDGGPEIQPDDKAHAQLRMLGSHPSLSQVFLYPRLLKIEYEENSEDNLAYSQIRCSSYKLNPPALCYILENGFYVILFISMSGSSNVKFLQSLFGPHVDSVTKIQPQLGLPNLLTNESQFVNRLLKKIEQERRRAYKLFIVRQGLDKSENVFKNFLYEDSKIVTRPGGGENKLEGLCYVDLLCHLHKEIRAQLN